MNISKKRLGFLQSSLEEVSINNHQVNLSEASDFLIDEKYTFEVGGKDKGKKQIATLENAYIVADDIEYGMGNKIPLWLFGFLY